MIPITSTVLKQSRCSYTKVVEHFLCTKQSYKKWPPAFVWYNWQKKGLLMFWQKVNFLSFCCIRPSLMVMWRHVRLQKAQDVHQNVSYQISHKVINSILYLSVISWHCWSSKKFPHNVLEKVPKSHKFLTFVTTKTINDVVVPQTAIVPIVFTADLRCKYNQASTIIPWYTMPNWQPIDPNS